MNSLQKKVQDKEEKQSPATAVLSLLTGAMVWGVIWYPYRVLRDAGVDGIVATTSTYSVAFMLGLAFFHRALRSVAWSPKLLWLAFASGGCNLGYVLATLNGEVVRVLLLFYLAPLWTVLLSRFLLGERLNRFGAFVVALSLSGAAIILWHPEAGMPVPRNVADWLGLGAGFSFALFNVLSRYTQDVSIEAKSMVSFAGVVIIGMMLILAGVGVPRAPEDPSAWLMLGLIGFVLVIINFVVQHGLTHLAANRAIVIMLSEVGVAALSSWLLAGETFGLRETLGGVMIIAASLSSARMEREEQRH